MRSRIAAAVLMFAALSGCALSVQAQGSVLKKDAKTVARANQDAVALAKDQLKAGKSDAEVEDFLRKGGLSADEAARAVALAKSEVNQAK